MSLAFCMRRGTRVRTSGLSGESEELSFLGFLKALTKERMLFFSEARFADRNLDLERFLRLGLGGCSESGPSSLCCGPEGPCLIGPFR